MNDQQTDVAIVAATDLAVALRDEGPVAVRSAAQRLLSACGNDPIAAVSVAAALIRTDQSIDAWWQRGLDAVGQVDQIRPCGTHSAFNRHRDRGEEPCPDCWEAERTYQRDAKRRQRRAAA